MKYLIFSDRSEDKIRIIEQYLRATKQLRNYADASQDPHYTQVGNSLLLPKNLNFSFTEINEIFIFPL